MKACLPLKRVVGPDRFELSTYGLRVLNCWTFLDFPRLSTDSLSIKINDLSYKQVR
jgi:hypothetical protein